MSSKRRGLIVLGVLALGINAVIATAAEEPPVPPPGGEIINVTTLDDTAEPDVLNCVPSANPAFDIDCPTLREAVMYANGSEVPSMDTIMLSAGTYLLTTKGTDEIFPPCEGKPEIAPEFTNIPDAAIGDLDITESLVIQGAGADATIVEWEDWGVEPDPALTSRVFHVYSESQNVFAEFHGIRVRNGLLLKQYLCEGPDTEYPPDEPAVAEPTEWLGMRAGGGIAIGPAANTVLYDPNREGRENSVGRGGSLKPDDHESGFTYVATVNETAMDANVSDGDGGGLYNAGPLTAMRIGIIGNTSGTNGGGIYNEGVTLIDTAVIADNVAEGGGGLFLTGRPDSVGPDTDLPVTILNSTISGNIGEDVGGGIHTNGNVTILFSTITGNKAIGAEQFGGSGVNVFYSELASVTLKNTLLSGNTAGSDEDPEIPVRDANCGCSGNRPDCVDLAPDRLIQTLGYNLSDDTSCNLNAVGDLLEGIDPRIGPLADNGGLTMTHKLLSGSPAINAGIAIDGVTTDQRGRNRDRKPDIGAYEVSFLGGGGGGGGCSMRTAQPASVDPLLALMLLVSMAWISKGRLKKSCE